MKNYIVSCDGCLEYTEQIFLSDDGYCESCQYEFEAKQDHKTDEEQ